MKVREAYEIIADLRRMRDHLRQGKNVEDIVNDRETYGKLKKYTEEIEKLESHIYNAELDDSYEVDCSLYTLKER
jgi:hypothetical protein